MTLKTSEQLITECQGLVRSLAWQIHCKLPSHVDLEDLISYGQIGLAEAARDFDPARSIQFTTFCYHRIRGAIFDGLAKMAWFRRDEYDRGTYESVTEPFQDAAESPDSADTRISRNSICGLEAGCVERSSKIRGDDAGQSPPDAAIHRETLEKLYELVEALPDPTRTLIRSAYFDGLSLKDAGDRLGISKSWASRLHAKALEDLANSFRLAQEIDWE